MRILHVLNHVRNSGNGIVNVTTDLACLQAQMGHSVGVVSQGGGNEELLARYGVTHFTIDQQRNRGLPAAVPKLHHLFRQFQPEVVHAQMITGLVLAKILQPFVGYALVSTVHNAFQRSTALMGLADRVITVSNAVAVGMRRRGTPQRKIRVILNGTLGTPRRRPLSDYTALSLQRPAITTIAGLYERKGISDLIDAFAAVGKKYASAHLFIVGDGPDRALFEKRAAQLDNDENIHFVGFQSEPECYLLSSDIFVLASHTDSAPLVLPEARQAGCAIVATAVDGIPELLDEGAAGMLVESRRPAALAAALEQLLGDDHLLATWRRRAQQNLERLGVQRVAEQTVDVYKELLDSRA